MTNLIVLFGCLVQLLFLVDVVIKVSEHCNIAVFATDIITLDQSTPSMLCERPCHWLLKRSVYSIAVSRILDKDIFTCCLSAEMQIFLSVFRVLKTSLQDTRSVRNFCKRVWRKWDFRSSLRIR
jgi:hypothetical protein